MIIYATKKTIERYDLPMPEEFTPPMDRFVEIYFERESGDRLLEWGAKLFDFDRKKCIQLVNFASKLTLFLFDIEYGDMGDIGNKIADYLYEIYKADEEMTSAIEKMLKSSPIFIFEKLKDRSAIATLNRTQSNFADDGYNFYRYIREGILHTIELNQFVNFDWFFTMTENGKTEYFFPAEKYREIVMERFGEKVDNFRYVDFRNNKTKGEP